jgi:hypothetical protein
MGKASRSAAAKIGRRHQIGYHRTLRVRSIAGDGPNRTTAKTRFAVFVQPLLRLSAHFIEISQFGPGQRPDPATAK